MTQVRQKPTGELQELDRRHHVHPFVDPKDLDRQGTKVLVRGQGCWLEDSEGRRVLDGMAGLWNVNVGYGRSTLAQAAADQMRRLPYYNTFFRSATEPAIELAERLSQLLPGDLGHAFFANSGSEANDTIVRLVRRYWDLQGKPDKKTFISRTYAYHGSTLAGASLGGMEAMHAQGDLPLPGFVHVMPPYWYVFGEDGEDLDAFGLRAAKAVEDKILELGADRVAAFIGEPVMGAGGVIPPPETYWPEVQRICRRHDVLLIADEVICGFGRTGEWFGIERYGIEPDLVPVAKGITSGYLPLSAVLMTDRIYDPLRDGGVLAHGYTTSGHPVAAAVALENLRIMEEEGLVEKVRSDTGPYFHERLATLADHPLVGEVRSVGLLGGFELVAEKESRTLFDPLGQVGKVYDSHAYKEGLIVRAMRDTIGLCPPLTISRSEIDALVEMARAALDRTQSELRD